MIKKKNIRGGKREKREREVNNKREEGCKSE